MQFFLLLLFAFHLLYGSAQEFNITPNPYQKSFMHVEILDQKELLYSDIKGVKFSELSGLSYDMRSKTLYLVGDKGTLFSFRAIFSNTIEAFSALDATTLKDKKGKALRVWKKDSEGVALDNEGRLYISFEGEAKIASFHKKGEKYGTLIEKHTLPKELRPTENYRTQNKSLESLTWHPKHGLLTAAEWPLKQYDKKRQTIYALNGKQWHFKAEPEGRSGFCAMEVMDDGNVLIIERSYTGFSNPLVITLKKVYLDRCKNEMCKTEILAKFNSDQGWIIDNFEGLAKVGRNRYIMISDNNDNFFQKTLLVYFEVHP